jgi:cytochrome c5
MKKLIPIIVAVAGVILLTALINIPSSVPSSQEAGKTQKAIPANVLKITENSCSGCHNEPGMKMAMLFLDLSDWDKYSTGKQASKAKKMCKLVTKGKMPPKHARANNPDLIPAKNDVKTICDWAASTKVPK